MITVLWALNSRCFYQCEYCYLNFSEDNNPINNKYSKKLGELSIEEKIEFCYKIKKYNIGRVFIVGAEPLSNPEETFRIIDLLKKMNIQVVLCTNGYDLPRLYKRILELKIDAISISLDSYLKEANDKYRRYPNKNGFEKVTEGLKLLINERNKIKSNMKIGIYTVMTKLNLNELAKTYTFVADFGVDYYVFQPVFLPENHKLYNDLSLTVADYIKLEQEITAMQCSHRNTILPNQEYIELVLLTLQKKCQSSLRCFGGKELFFITPDGGIHKCPSECMINKETEHYTIRDDLDKVFIKKLLRAESCDLFSADCVNMWQLMSFDHIIDNSNHRY